MDGHRVNVSGHQILDGVIHSAVPLELAQPGKCSRHDHDGKVPPPIADTRMSYVTVTIVNDVQASRVERSLQSVADPVYTRRDGRFVVVRLHATSAQFVPDPGASARRASHIP